MSLRNNIAKVIITGASGGIGSATADVLEKKGATVIKLDRKDADLASYENVGSLCKKILNEHASIDWVVFSHGFIDVETEFLKQSKAHIDATFAINTLSIIYCTQLLLAHVRKGFIFVSSSAAVAPNGRYAVYSASKAAVNGFSQALAKNIPELSFIALCPGATNTPMRQKIASDADSAQSPGIVADIIANIVAGTTPYKSGDIVLVKNGEHYLHGQPRSKI